MKAEIVSVGSELTCGISLDTNAQWLSERLGELGIPVGFHTTVGDDLEDNLDVFRHAAKRANVVVVTGGLGPTADDLTREALAKLAGTELVLDETSLKLIEQMFQLRGRQMPERNRVQALFPKGAEPIRNANGTAPGIWMEYQQCVFVCLPGVPSEMKAMFQTEVAPRLRARFPSRAAIAHRIIRCFGAGESQIEEMLGDMTARGRQPEIGITASEATISLRITATGPTYEEAFAAVEPDAKLIYEKLGDLVYGENHDQLHTIVGRKLLETNTTISTAESCTGGLLGHWLTEIPGISPVYLGGVVSYSNEAKMDLLNVPKEMLDQFGAVSPQVAQAMAEGCRNRFKSQLGVGITGVAGPGGGSATKPVGLVYVALAHPTGVELAKYNWGGDRTSIKIRSAKTALNLVRLYLKKKTET